MNVTLEEYNTAIKHYDSQLTIEAAKLESASQAQRDEFKARIDACTARITVFEADLASAATERDRLAAEITTDAMHGHCGAIILPLIYLIYSPGSNPSPQLTSSPVEVVH
jgi:outer membrane protein TolC